MARTATAREREAIALRMDGMTYDQIGESLGVSRQRAVQMIRDGISAGGRNRNNITAERCVFPRIRDWLLENEYTAIRLSNDTGIHPATLGRILKGKDGLFSNFKAIADRLGMPIQEAFSLDD